MRESFLKNVTILCLLSGPLAPHIVCPQGGVPSILLLAQITSF